MSESAAAARQARAAVAVGAWWALLGIAGLLFYFLLAPFWLGLRGLAWIAEFRARGRA